MKDGNIGKKIMVIGSPGSGKSTFSRRLAEKTGLPLIHLDREYWNAGWIETPREEWIRKQELLVAQDEWIMDGNYGGTMEIRLEKADTVILFDLNRWVCLTGCFRRVMTNIGRVRPDMPEGCPEKFDVEFMKYIWNFPKASGQGNKERLSRYPDKNIVVFNRRSQAEAFLRKL